MTRPFIRFLTRVATKLPKGGAKRANVVLRNTLQRTSSESRTDISPALERYLERRAMAPRKPEFSVDDLRFEQTTPKVTFSKKDLENMLVKTDGLEGLLDESETDDSLFDALDYAFQVEQQASKVQAARRGETFSQQRRNFSTSRTPQTENKGANLLEICPWYCKIENPQNDREKDFNMIVSILTARIFSLDDGFHKAFVFNEATNKYQLAGRTKVIAEYHQAFLDAERAMLENPAPSCRKAFDDKVEISTTVTNHDKAKGTALIARIGDKVVARMFMANAPDAMHFTFLSTYNTDKLKESGINATELQAQVLETFLDNIFAEEKLIRTSCIADYKQTLITMAKEAGVLASNKMFKFEPRDEDDAIYGDYIGNPDAASVAMQIKVKDLRSLVDAYISKKEQQQTPSGNASEANGKKIGAKFNPLDGDVPCP